MLMNLEGDLSKARKKAGKKKSLLKPFLKTKPEYFIVSVAAKQCICENLPRNNTNVVEYYKKAGEGCQG